MGADMYRQEYLCEFFEPDEQVFSYDEIDDMMHPAERIRAMDFGIPKSPEKALVF